MIPRRARESRVARPAESQRLDGLVTLQGQFMRSSHKTVTERLADSVRYQTNVHSHGIRVYL